jgi:hypothetical protein
MTLPLPVPKSPKAIKLTHTLIVAAASGGLSYITGALSSGQLLDSSRGLRSFVVGILSAAASRVAGALLNKIQETSN